MISVVIADDHPAFRAGLRMLLEESGIVVSGEAADGDEAYDAVLRERPDVALLDLQMPGKGGVEVTRLLRQLAEPVPVLVLTMVESDETVLAATRAGASGYLLKGAGQEELERAVRSVAAGQVVYGSGVGQRVQAHLARSGTTAFPELSPREQDVLLAMADGRRNHEIARQLFLSEKTVRNHVTTIFAKLGVSDRAAAVAVAHDRARK